LKASLGLRHCAEQLAGAATPVIAVDPAGDSAAIERVDYSWWWAAGFAPDPFAAHGSAASRCIVAQQLASAGLFAA
jgi:hypothetical protein